MRFDKRNMFSLAVLQAALSLHGIATNFSKEPQDGIMIYSLASAQAQEVYAEVQAAQTRSVFVAGGPHPSAKPDEALEYFDYVVIGEGEQTLPALVRALFESEDAAQVQGIAFTSARGVIVTERPHPICLDDYPPFLSRLKAPIEISRGCPFGCRYCQTPRLFGNKMRHRSVDFIAKYSEYLSDVRFISPNAFAYGSSGKTADYAKIEQLLQRLEGNIYFGTFPSEVRPEFISEELLELVVNSCSNNSIHFGAQSGSDRVLDDIGRAHSRHDIEVALDVCLGNGLVPTVDFIFALPTETEADQFETLDLVDFIVSKGGRIRAHYFTPLPGTPYQNEAPSILSRDVNKELGKLARDGKLTGHWN